MSRVIDIVTALIQDEAGRVLLVRKRGFDVYMQPGGKREPGESDIETLTRELQEELGGAIAPHSFRNLAQYEADAANEPGARVRASVCAVQLMGPVEPRAEIEAIAWIDPNEPGAAPLAQLTERHILPLARAQRRP